MQSTKQGSTKQGNTKQSSTKQSSTKQGNKPFCKVCFDAGKTIAEYSTHYVRDQPGGVVICPTILTQQCNYCKKNGHTPKHCPELEGKYNKHRPESGKHQPESGKHQPESGKHQPESGKHKPESGKHQPESGKPKPESGKPKPEVNYKDKTFKPFATTNEAALSDNFPVIGVKDGESKGSKIIRSTPVILNAWASVVVKAAKQAQAEQAQAEQTQAYSPQDYSKCSWADYE